MQVHLQIGSRRVWADLGKPISIGIRQSFGPDQVNHFGVDVASRQPIRSSGFVGSTSQGGSCNVDQISIIPHCNGTHIEHVGHIVDKALDATLSHVPPLMSAALITVQPIEAKLSGAESYRPPLSPTDCVIPASSLRRAAEKISLEHSGADALIVRTLPNDDRKLHFRYGVDLDPPFFTIEALNWILDHGFEHLLVDFPSLDRMHDDGLLTNHHLFWNVPEQTHLLANDSSVQRSITEMVFVPTEVPDGHYLLNLQFPDWATDAAPARPLLFAIQEHEHNK